MGVFDTEGAGVGAFRSLRRKGVDRISFDTVSP